MKMIRLFEMVAAAAALAVPAQAQDWSVTSPNGLVKLTVQLADLGGTAGYPKGISLYYRVEQGPKGSRAAVLNDSPLGLWLKDWDIPGEHSSTGIPLLPFNIFDSAQPQKMIDEAYQMPHGKRKECRNRASHQTLVFRNAAGKKLEIDLRAYDNGVAFRYRLPGDSGARPTLVSELTGFAMPVNTKMWMAPNEKAEMYKPAYEAYYENEIAVGTPPPFKVGWAIPALVHTASGRWALITESNLDKNFYGSRLSSDAPNGIYRIAPPIAAEGNGQGSVQPSAALPWEMPWRVILVGGSLGDIVESTLVTDVAAPSKIKDASWIRPGRVAWSWWSDQPSPKDGAKQCKFVDLAAEMGWEYVLVDANWDIMDNGNIHDVLRHAKKKGVGVILWYNSGGPHNIVTEKPRDTLTQKPVRLFELDLLKEWGVKGIKVDFFQSDKQDVIGLYQDILADAAEKQIMVDFHGCTIPRGWQRTWPNLMSMEAVRGAEYYIFDADYPRRAPVQNTITPFARNVVGPMDFTPVTFSDNKYPHRTTAAHDLALSVVFESGLLHLADKAEAYLNLPSAPKEFLKHVPVAWDDTRFIAGYPGQFVILARRKGDTWYLAGINGLDRLREESVKPGAWLGAGRYELTLIGDGADTRTLADNVQTLESGSAFTVKMLPYGGFVATLKPSK